jgi:hypothetical protein
MVNEYHENEAAISNIRLLAVLDLEQIHRDELIQNIPRTDQRRPAEALVILDRNC